jgi:hypothetical protein
MEDVPDENCFPEIRKPGYATSTQVLFGICSAVGSVRVCFLT